MIKKLTIAALAGVLLMPLLASARHAVVRDPNDARGLLDIRRAEMAKSKPPKWKVKTRQRWTVAEMWDHGFVLVYVDTFGDGRADYYALVRSNGLRMVGSLYRDRETKKDFKVRSLSAGHPTRRLVNVKIPLHKLRRRGSRLYRWYTLTMFSGGRCKRFCFDRAPNNGQVMEPGPGPTPTLPPPTPTPTITP